MKTIRKIGMVFLAVAFALNLSSCDDDNDEVISYTNPYKDYPQLIVGKWFNFTPEASVFVSYQADNTCSMVGWDKDYGWLAMSGIYRVEGNKFTISSEENNQSEASQLIIIEDNKLTFLPSLDMPDVSEKVNYRVKESFDIKGNYTYLNSAARVVPAEGKTALQLPEGVNYKGQNFIPIDDMHGERIIAAMQKFFEDATFAENGTLMHTTDGEVKTKNYTLNGNNLTFNLYEGSETYNVNATSFPDEDGDRLFIIIPKQAAWLGGMVELVEKENPGLTLNEAQIAQLEQEFMSTFETFTVILSLSKK